MRTRPPARLLVSLVALVVVACVRSAMADTTETFDAGAADMEVHMGFDGLHRAAGERTIAGEVVIGYGLVDGLSAVLGAAMEADQGLDSGETGFDVGVLATPYDSDHVDVDLMLLVGAGAGGLGDLHVAPGFELNLDVAPDMASFGVYLRGGVPVYGRTPDGGASEVALDVEATLGTYYTVRDGHQLLLEYETAFHPRPATDEAVADVGSVSLGYNAALLDELELVSAVFASLPDGGVPVGFGVSLGVIVTVGPEPAAVACAPCADACDAKVAHEAPAPGDATALR